MAVKQLKPTSPGMRGMQRLHTDDITATKPEKSLVEILPAHSGRNNNGRITTRHQGGRHKRQYRIIDFKRNKLGVPGTIATIEYDPNRNVRICLVNYADGEKRYILAAEGLAVGDTVMAGPEAEIQTGNALPMMSIPLGTQVHNIEMKKGRGGQMVRAAGTSAQLVAKEGDYVTLRLPSGEMRLIRRECYATIGSLGNADIQNTTGGKAGRTRWKGIRPTVRGSVMNPVDHPHGGGEGKSPVGRARPVSPWGKPALGAKTRKPKKQSSKYIVAKRSRR